MDIKSSFTFARPSFVSGWASLFDFGNTLFEITSMSDEECLRRDWEIVQEDIRLSLGISPQHRV